VINHILHFFKAKMHFVVGLLFLISLNNCQDSSGKKSNNNWIGKTIAFDNIVMGAINDTTTHIESLMYKSYKLLVYIDGNCGLCFNELNYWKNFKEKHLSDDSDVSFVFILESDNVVQSAYYLDEISFKDPVFYDKDGIFFKSNGLSYDKNYLTMILNLHNEIILLGSPINNPKIEKEILVYFRQ